MFGFGKTETGRTHAAFIGLCIALSVGGAAASARPAQLDRSFDRFSDHGVFHLQVGSAATPIPMSRVHQWTVHLTDVTGQPISGATLAVDGGMPEHHHGLPTAPRAAPGLGAGDYVISGMKFSMRGWWVLKLAVTSPDGRADTITFNVVL
jgi:hypothetical protein